jgi:hypothetical protein
MKKFSTCRAHLRWRWMFPASRPHFAASIASQTLCCPRNRDFCPRNRDFFLPTPTTAHSNPLLVSGAAPLPIQWWQPIPVVGCHWRKRASSTVLLCFSVHFLFSGCSLWPWSIQEAALAMDFFSFLSSVADSRTHRGRFDSWATLSPTQVQRCSQSTVPWSFGVGLYSCPILFRQVLSLYSPEVKKNKKKKEK